MDSVKGFINPNFSSAGMKRTGSIIRPSACGQRASISTASTLPLSSSAWGWNQGSKRSPSSAACSMASVIGASASGTASPPSARKFDSTAASLPALNGFSMLPRTCRPDAWAISSTVPMRAESSALATTTERASRASAT